MIAGIIAHFVYEMCFFIHFAASMNEGARAAQGFSMGPTDYWVEVEGGFEE